jgi:hypothetical protein
MGLQDLSLPVDVPWKLIATSTDMLAEPNKQFPNATWKSSMAVFAYDPDLTELPDVFPDRELTFIKVVCSITSYTPSCGDLPPPPTPPDIKDYGEDYAAYEAALQAFYIAYAAWQQQIANIEKICGNTYPCYGALIQIAIYPSPVPENNDIDHYNIYRGTESGFPVDKATIHIAQPTTNLYSDKDVSPSTTYYYRVAAVDKPGNIGPPSLEVSSKTSTNIPFTTPPSRVNNLKVSTVSDTQLDLSWDAIEVAEVTDVSKLAYFASFEPKKRELIEAVTESGESMTQSKSALDVRKGVTSTDSTDNYDLFTGANVNVGFGVGMSVGLTVHTIFEMRKMSVSSKPIVNLHNQSISDLTRDIISQYTYI